VKITGAPEAVAAAKAQVAALTSGEHAVQGGPAPGGAEQTLQIQQQHVGKIIGKGGETIKGMQGQTGCRIHIDQTAWTVTITGTQQAVDSAAAMITTITNGGDPPQYGPPGGAYGGGYGGGYAAAAPQAAMGGYGGGHGHPYGQGYQQPAYGGYQQQQQQQPAYGGYQQQQQPAYGGYQQQQPAYGGYQQQMPAATPAAGPSTRPPASGASAWAAHNDAQGRTYYYNSSTQQSQWEKPADMA